MVLVAEVLVVVLLASAGCFDVETSIGEGQDVGPGDASELVFSGVVTVWLGLPVELVIEPLSKIRSGRLGVMAENVKSLLSTAMACPGVAVSLAGLEAEVGWVTVGLTGCVWAVVVEARTRPERTIRQGNVKCILSILSNPCV